VKRKMKVIGRVEAAERLGMSPQALSCHVSRRNWDAIPKPIMVGRRFKWIEEKLEEWLLERFDESVQSGMQKARRGPGRPPKQRSAPCS
jgi:predicted DNA-binding transcriptional regulator AlpA